jgi:flagellar biosynthesis/type III secretory pathway protein FliH
LSSASGSAGFVADPVFKSPSARQGFASGRVLANPNFGPDDTFMGVDGAKAFGVSGAASARHAAPASAVDANLAEPNAVEADDQPQHQGDAARVAELEAALAAQQAEQEAAVERAKAQAFAEGQAQGQQEAKQMLEMEQAADNSERAIELGDMLSELIDDARQHLVEHQDIFDPLKRLALSLAEQMARRELTLSDESMTGFIQQAIEQLDGRQLNELTIHVSNDWYQRLQQPELAELFSQYGLRRDDNLQPGSVRLVLDDASIEDLIEHRISQLAEQLRLNTPPSQQRLAGAEQELDLADEQTLSDNEFFASEFDDQGAIIQGDYSEVDDIFFQRPEDE